MEDKTTEIQSGTWANLNTEEVEKKPKVEFPVGKPVVVTFAEEFTEPREMPQKDGKGVFYIFDCRSSGEDRVIMTSAWTLMRGLKSNLPLSGKSLKIEKVMKDGKQHYEVEEVKNDTIPEEQVKVE